MSGKIAALLLFLAAPSLWASPCNDPHVPISLVQGHGKTSPLQGRQVSVQGILTADLRHPGGFRGFYLQQALSDQDSDDTTSEGLFIQTDASGGEPGDRVLVTGDVREYYGLTSLTGVSQLHICGHSGLPIPQVLSVNDDPAINRESLEGMLVRTEAPLAITDTWNLERYGELVLAPSLQLIPTQQVPPGPEASRLHQEQQRQRLILDDGLRHKHPRPIPYLTDDDSASGNSLRIGDQIAPLVAILDYRFGDWRLQPVSRPDVQHSNPRKPPPARHPQTTIRVASLNLGNLFNGDGQGNGFPTARGAASHGDYQRQLARLTRQIHATDPDILAVSELENDGYGTNSAMAALSRSLGRHWQFVEGDTDRHDDAIRNGLLYREDRVHPLGPATLIDDNALLRWHRPALAQGFRRIDGDRALTVVAVHLKSKRCRSAPPAQQDGDDGQGCFAAARDEASQQLSQWRPPGAGPDSLVLLAGDFNAYAMEKPLQTLASAGFTDLIAYFHGLEQQTFRFHGRQGTLDYHLANDALTERVLASQAWSVNAEEPRLWAYDASNTPVVPDGFLWRASDHNPVITDFRL